MLALASLSLALSEEPPRPHSQGVYAVDSSVSLEFVLPATWNTGWRPNDDGRPDSALFAPERAKGFTLLVSPFPGPSAGLSGLDARSMAESMRKGIEGRRDAVPGPIQEFHGQRRAVYWFVTPTKNLGRDGFRWFTAGAAALAGTMVTFNLLHDAEPPSDRVLVLQALGRAREVDPRKARVAGTVSLALRGKPWAVLVDVPGLTLEHSGESPGGSAVVSGHSGETGVVASMTLSPAPGLGGPAEARATYFEKALLSPFEKHDVARSQRGAMAIGEYLIARHDGRDVRQKHVNAYLVRDGVWIDVHLSKVDFRPADQALFDGVLDSIRYSDAPDRE